MHCDLNCYFASVEMLYHPELREVPMAIAGDPENRHGIILTKNALAKKAGVKTAEPIWQAKKKCPNLVIRQPDYESYEYFSKKVKALYYEYTDKVESFGLDECWLDITDSIKLFGSIQNIVIDIIKRIQNEIGLTLSIGVSNNKIWAKLGSDIAGESEYYVISKLSDIENLPASSLLNVGSHTFEKLKNYGLITIGDIAKCSSNYLKGIFGKWGEMMWYFANGYDLSEVSVYDEPYEVVKSIGNSSTTIRDIYDLDDLKVVLTILSDSVGARVKEAGMYFKTVHLYLRNKKLEWRTMQVTLKENSDLVTTIFNTAIELFKTNGLDFSVPYRSIGVSVSNLSFKKEASSIRLFEDDSYSLKEKQMDVALEKIRSRYGYHSVAKLRVMEDTELSNFDIKNEHTVFPVSYFRK